MEEPRRHSSWAIALGPTRIARRVSAACKQVWVATSVMMTGTNAGRIVLMTRRGRVQNCLRFFRLQKWHQAPTVLPQRKTAGSHSAARRSVLAVSPATLPGLNAGQVVQEATLAGTAQHPPCQHPLFQCQHPRHQRHWPWRQCQQPQWQHRHCQLEVGAPVVLQRSRSIAFL